MTFYQSCLRCAFLSLLALIFLSPSSVFAEESEQPSQVVPAKDSSSGKVFLPEPFASIVNESERAITVKESLSKEFRYTFVPTEEVKDELLRAEAQWSFRGSFGLNFHMLTWSESDLLEEYRGEFIRMYPRGLDAYEKTQRWREKVTLYSGARNDAMRWLTIRPLGEAEDNVWSYSPTLKSTRRLNSVNREDRLFHSALSLDDILLFSRKAEGLKLIEQQTARQLLPLVADKKVIADLSKDCYSINPAGLRSAVQLDYGQFDTQRKRFARWLSQETFYPRDVVILVYEALDPYRELAHEILIVDAEFWIPIYRLSYDVLGRLRFSSYQVLGIAQVEDQFAPAIVYSLVYDHEGDKVTMLRVQEQSWCDVDAAAFSELQPQKLVPEKVVIPKKSPKESASSSGNHSIVTEESPQNIMPPAPSYADEQASSRQ